MSLWKWWIAIAGTALVVGGVAWLLKLWVIVATDGRVVATGAAGAFFDLGLYLLMVGSTGVGLRLAMNQETSQRIVLAVVSPLAFVFSFAIFLSIGYALVAIGRLIVGDALPSYLLEEAGIFISAVAWLVVGIWLLIGVAQRGAARGTRGASGSREAEPQPRVR
jgi:hypothetical protein